jgi:Holliday junction resolvase RusA-like endonuclease
MISFTLDIDPVAKGRPRFYKGYTVTPYKTRHFENSVRVMVTPYRPKKLLLGPIKLEVDFFIKPPARGRRAYPTTRPDTDNLIKSVSDSCNGIFWKDDSQIVEIYARKLYDYVNRTARIVVTIEEIG